MSSRIFVEHYDSAKNLEAPFPTLLSDYSIQDFLQTPEGEKAQSRLTRAFRVWKSVKQSSWLSRPDVVARVDVILNTIIRRFAEKYIKSHPLGFFFGSHVTRSLSDQVILIKLRTDMEKEHFLYSLDREELGYLPF